MSAIRPLTLICALVICLDPLLTGRAGFAYSSEQQNSAKIDSDDDGATASPPTTPTAQGQYLTAQQVQQMIDAALQAQAAALPIPSAQIGPPDGAPCEASSLLVEPSQWSIDFKNGIQFKSADNMFSLRFNDLTQVDYRNFSQTAGNSHTITSLQDNFNIPREWLFFRGTVTEYFDYQTVIAVAGGMNVTGAPATVNLLDAYLDFNPFGSEYKDQLQIRVGRFKTPYMYQFYKLAPQDYVTPELSMYGTNFNQNRQDGVMAHGYLADKRIDYAAGIFNGVTNSNEVAQSNRQSIYYLGLAPFLLEEGSVLQNLNLVGSAAVGQQFGTALPGSLGTAAPSVGPPNNTITSPTFLSFTPSGVAGDTTIRQGMQALSDFEVVYAYQSFNFYGEYNNGYQTYALQSAAGTVVPNTTQEVRVNGWSAAATYFITGEKISVVRSRVQPLREYGSGGLGAFEGFGRYSNVTLGNNVFTDHLASPALFANSVNATDIGVNWYLNQYVKFTFDWQHSLFNNPVSLTGAAGGNMTKTMDLLWGRFQLYY